MSRRKTVEPTVIVLASWLTQLVAEFVNYKQLLEQDIELVIKAP